MGIDKKTVIAILREYAEETYNRPEDCVRKSDLVNCSYAQTTIDQLCKYVEETDLERLYPEEVYMLFDKFLYMLKRGWYISRTERSRNMYLRCIEVVSDVMEVFCAME